MVILAAGDGIRMNSRTPKVLHAICGQPMLSLAIRSARDAGLERILAVVPHESGAIREAIGPSVEYVEQEQPLGTGHALLQTLPVVRDTDNLLVLYGDVPLIRPETMQQMMALHTDREASITLLTSTLCPPDGMGRVLRDSSGSVTAIVEEKEADQAALEVAEVNGGVYCFQTRWLGTHLQRTPADAGGEIYLTDLVSLAAKSEAGVEAVSASDLWEVLGINHRGQLAQAEAALRQRIREKWMLAGVTLIDPGSTYIDAAVVLGQDSILYPNTHVRGETRIGADCHIGPNSIIESSSIGDRCRIVASVVEGSTLEEDVEIGPYSHVRPESYIEGDVHIGNYAEVKKSRLGHGTRIGHFSYIGDATLGSNVNVGAGAITCNYDGVNKNETIIGEDAFIGSDTMLVAPVRIGARAATGAGSLVTKDVPPDTLVVGVPARVTRKSGHRRNSRSVAEG